MNRVDKHTKSIFFMCDLPNFSTPIANSTQPAKNAKIIANSAGLPAVYRYVSWKLKLNLLLFKNRINSKSQIKSNQQTQFTFKCLIDINRNQVQKINNSNNN